MQGSADADSLFTTGTRLYLQQAHYRHILTRWRTLAGHLAAVDTLSIDDLEPVYANLRRHLQNQGLSRDANACFVEGMERRRRHSSLTDPGFYALSLLQLSTRYGTDPIRLAFSACCIVLVCGFAYRLGRSAFATPPDTAPPSLAACLLFSLQTFISTSTSPWHFTGAMRLLALLQALIGWICLALLIATLLSHMA